MLQGLHQASSHLQQLQAHLLRTSPYLSPQNSFIHSYLPNPHHHPPIFGHPPAKNEEDNVVSSTMEEMEDAVGGRKERQKRGPKNRSKSVEVAAASSSTSNDREDLEEEKEFFETHCHWVHCDRDFETQDQLVKVAFLSEIITLEALYLEPTFSLLAFE